jgi:Xaa-Pro dipeptidase
MTMGVRNIKREFVRKPAPAQLCNLDRLVAHLEASGLDGLVALFATNQYYLSSFGRHHSIPEEMGMFPVVLSRHDPDHPILCMADVDVRRLATQPTWIKEVRPYATVLPHDVAVRGPELRRFVPQDVLSRTGWDAPESKAYRPNLAVAIKGAIRDLGLHTGKIGFDNLALGLALIDEFPDAQALPADNLLRAVRSAKTDPELKLLRQATQIHQTALERTVRQWTPGLSWHDVMLAYQVHVLALGGEPNLPDCFAIANAPGGDPAFHADPEVVDYELTEGMAVMFDAHGKYNGYCWDGGKTWIVGGQTPSEVKRTWAATMAASDAINEALRPGRRISELVEAGRRAYRQSGVSDSGVLIYFHGLGLDHIDQDLSLGTGDWIVQRHKMISTHIHFPGDETQRLFMEDIAFVRDDGVERFFTWDDRLL